MDDVALPSLSPTLPVGYGEGYYEGTAPPFQPRPVETLYATGPYGHLNDRPMVSDTNTHHFRSGRRHSVGPAPSHSRSRHSRSRSRSPRPQHLYGGPIIIPRPPSPPSPGRIPPPPVAYANLDRPFDPNPITSPYAHVIPPVIHTSPWIPSVSPIPTQAFVYDPRTRPDFLRNAPLGTYTSALIIALPRDVYLLFLLRLPSFYFSRVDRIFRDADLSIGQVKEMALKVAAEEGGRFRSNLLSTGPYYRSPDAPSLPPAYKSFKANWETLVGTLIK